MNIEQLIALPRTSLKKVPFHPDRQPVAQSLSGFVTSDSENAAPYSEGLSFSRPK